MEEKATLQLKYEFLDTGDEERVFSLHKNNLFCAGLKSSYEAACEEG